MASLYEVEEERKEEEQEAQEAEAEDSDNLLQCWKLTRPKPYQHEPLPKCHTQEESQLETSKSEVDSDSDENIESIDLCDEVHKRLLQIDTESLSEDHKITLRLLDHYVNTCSNGYTYGNYHMNFYMYEGPDLRFVKYTLPQLHFRESVDYYEYIEALKGYDQVILSELNLLRDGLNLGLTQNEKAMGDSLTRLKNLTTLEYTEWNHYSPFKFIPTEIPSDVADDIILQASMVFKDSIVPAMKQYYQFVSEEYWPKLRPSPSLNSLPDLQGRYEAVLRFHIDDSATPQYVHELGLKETNRLIEQIEQIQEQLHFKGTLREFTEHLFAKEEMAFQTNEEAVQYCKDYYKNEIRDKMRGCFSSFSDRPVRFTMVVNGSPTIAEYNAPTEEHPATLRFSNRLKDVCRKYDVPSLMVHELEPGHHLQASVALQQTNLPMFRRAKDDRHYSTIPGRIPLNAAYTEGWAMYCEVLGEELGLYDDPYSLFGCLSGMLARSVRMVIDAGIHAFNWDRERCVAFMWEHTALSDTGIQSEINRYIAIPAQGCCYTYGLLKFQGLRKHAEQQLGEKFIPTEFHDAVLHCGQVPLNILDDIVQRYIDRNLGKM